MLMRTFKVLRQIPVSKCYTLIVLSLKQLIILLFGNLKSFQIQPEWTSIFFDYLLIKY